MDSLENADKFFADWPNDVPACRTCRHKIPGTKTCAAFPDGIPVEIRNGSNQHRAPVPGDNGIQWAPIEDEEGES